MGPTKKVIWTIKLTTDGPIDTDKILIALKPLGEAEIVNYAVKTVK